MQTVKIEGWSAEILARDGIVKNFPFEFQLALYMFCMWILWCRRVKWFNYFDTYYSKKIRSNYRHFRFGQQA